MTEVTTGDVNSHIQPAAFFAFRTPLLPFDEFERWSEGLEAPAALVAQGLDLEAALTRDGERLRARLRTIVDRAAVREALFVASADLDHALKAWANDPGNEKGRRAEHTLVRYFARMASRCTPFGLFAGLSVGRVGPATRLQTAGSTSYRRHVRLDVNYLAGLAEAVVADPGLQSALRFRPNSSLYRTAGQLRYAEGYTRGAQRSYHLVAVEETPYLARVLERATRGAPLEELTACLVNDEVTGEDASAFVQELVASQVLVPDFTPAVTGPEPVHDLLGQLDQLPPGSAASALRCGLEQVQSELDQLAAQPLGVAPGRYRAAAAPLAEQPAAVAVGKLFQVDLVKPAPAATLGADVVAEIKRVVEVLHSVQRPRDRFRDFRDAFQRRYERAEVSLCEVLDEEHGIGFEASQAAGTEPSPLLEGVPFPAAPAEATSSTTPLDGFLLRRLLDAGRRGVNVVALECDELKPFALRERPPLPGSFAVMATLAAASSEALMRGEFQLVFGGASGPSGANLLGRFCHGDARLLREVRAFLREEEAARPDAVYAEIVHLPAGRTGNVILRPVLRDYEIPFLGRSGVAEERQIPLHDLTVAVEGERIVLRSRRLGREVIPRLTTAHNYADRGLGAYRFLCSLQQQGVSGIGWSWGSLEGVAFLPRVTIGRAVVSRQRWRVERDELKEVLRAARDARWRGLQGWRVRRRLPRWVLLADGDNKLLFDLDNVVCMDTLLDAVERRSQFVLEELYPGPDELCCTGPEGRFVHELIVPFTSPRADDRQPARIHRGREHGPALRVRVPGSDWLYAKLYTGTGGVDTLLREVIAPLVREAPALGITRWFFVRYGDPDWHLRVRFQGAPDELLARALPGLHARCEPLLARGTLWRVQLDTYQREIERYGGPEGLLVAERFFHLDSQAALGVIEALLGAAGNDARWRLALLGMDQILGSFGFELDARRRFATEARASLLREFQANAHLRHRLGERFRAERRALDLLFDTGWTDDSSVGDAVCGLRQHSTGLRAAAADLHALSAQGALAVPLESLVRSYLHMHVNRMVRAANTSHELILYDFLVRLYESRKARSRQTADHRPPA